MTKFVFTSILILFTSEFIFSQIHPFDDTIHPQKHFIYLQNKYEQENSLEIPTKHTRFYEELDIINDENYSLSDIKSERLWQDKSHANTLQDYNRLDTFWLRWEIICPKEPLQPFIFYLQRWTHIDLYLPDVSGIYHHLESGTSLNPQLRSIKDPLNYFRWMPASEDTLTCYARVFSAYPNVTLPPREEFFIAQVDEKAFFESKVRNARFLPFQGFLLAQVIYGLIIFLLVRERMILYYLFLSFGNLLADLTLSPSETIFQLAPQIRPFQPVIVNLAVLFIIIGGVSFVWEYTGLKKFLPSGGRFLKGFFLILLALFLVSSPLNIYYDTIVRTLSLSNSSSILLRAVTNLSGSFAYSVGFFLILSIPFYAIVKKIKYAWILFISTIFPASSSILYNIGVIRSYLTGQSSLYDSTLVGGDMFDFYPFIQLGIFFFITVFAILVGLKAREIISERQHALAKKAESEKKAAEELQKVFEATNRFVPHEFIRSLGHDLITDVALGDHVERKVTVMFSDIRGYTTLSESMKPEENFQFIKAFNSRISPVIHQNGGFINQYLGDGIMALFTTNSTDALLAAINMQKVLHSYNQERQTKNRISINMGIGFHLGNLILGVIGEPMRMEVATISDVVNTAARIESLTKYFGVNILISEDCYQNITTNTDNQHFHFRFMGKVKVKGKNNALGLYECYDGDILYSYQKKLEATELFQEGIRSYYNREFTNAKVLNDQVLLNHPEDKPAQLLREKINACLHNEIPSDWTGVEEMQFK